LIGSLSGRLIAKQPPQVLLEVAGVGYEIDVPMSTFYNLPATGEPLKLHTHLVVREDAHVLYGFATLEERSVFRKLIRISGVGARTALSVLSGLSVADLAQAVTLQDTARLTKVPASARRRRSACCLNSRANSQMRCRQRRKPARATMCLTRCWAWATARGKRSQP
jgi:Holliday junction DNA helicase RuvA